MMVAARRLSQNSSAVTATNSCTSIISMRLLRGILTLLCQVVRKGPDRCQYREMFLTHHRALTASRIAIFKELEQRRLKLLLQLRLARPLLHP